MHIQTSWPRPSGARRRILTMLWVHGLPTVNLVYETMSTHWYFLPSLLPALHSDPFPCRTTPSTPLHIRRLTIPGIGVSTLLVKFGLKFCGPCCKALSRNTDTLTICSRLSRWKTALCPQATSTVLRLALSHWYRNMEIRSWCSKCLLAMAVGVVH